MRHIIVDDNTIEKAAGIVEPGNSLQWNPPDGSAPTVFKIGKNRELIWLVGDHRAVHLKWPHNALTGK
jgi:hypothetical protein